MNLEHNDGMRSCKKWFMVTLLGLLLCAVVDGKTQFIRYQTILDRKPFGEAPPPEVVPVVIPEKDKFVRNFRMSAIVEVEEVWKIGLIELKTKEDFYLAVGETQKGVKLISVDWDKEEATIEKGIEIVVLKLGTGEVVPVNAGTLKQPVSARPVSSVSRAPAHGQRGVRRSLSRRRR